MNKQRRPKAKMNIPMCVAMVLLCLTLITTHMMCGLYARYIARASGEDSARVAEFGQVTITETGDMITENVGGEDYTYLVVTPGVNLKKHVEISFTGSEMACYLFVVVKPTGWSGVEAAGIYTSFNAFDGNAAAANITWEVDSTSWTYLTKDEVGQYIYYRVLEPNTEINDMAFIKNGDIIVGNGITKSMINDFVESSGKRKLDFTAIAIQYDGESTALEMWEMAKDK